MWQETPSTILRVEDIHMGDTSSLGLRLGCILAQDQLHGNITLLRTNGTEFCITFEEVT